MESTGRGPDNDRLIGLSDGIFAFAMTLMVLTIDGPQRESVAPSDMPAAVLGQWPAVLSYALSFLVVGTFWAQHRAVFRHIDGHDAGLVWLNLCFLLCVSFIPFPTDLVGEYADQQFAVVLYASSMAIASLLLWALWWYVSHDGRLVQESLQRHHIRYLSLRLLVTPAVFLASIGLSFVSLRAAEWSWVLIIPLRYLLSRRYERERPGQDYRA